MARTSILTDSTSGLTPEEASPLGIAIVPVNIQLDGHSFREGVDLSAQEFYQQIAEGAKTLRTAPPTVRQFHDAFRALGANSDEIVAIHVSSRLSGLTSVARQAAQSYLGRTRITVIDSRMTATPLAWLATAAAEAAAAGVDSAEIVRLLRAMMPHLYLAFFAESMEVIQGGGLIRRTAAVTATPPAAKPLLMIEEGEIVALERSRSRGRPVDRLFEFVSEFSRLERITILQGRPLPEALELATMLNEEMPEQAVETRSYPPSVAAHIGTEALGVAVYEGLR